MCINQNLTLYTDFNKIKNDYPELILNQEIIEGFWTVNIENQKFVYSILIKAYNYPEQLPKLYLKNCKHIKGVERHIYEDGECCVGVGQLEVFNKFEDFKINIKDYLEHLVYPYLFSQSFYDYYGEWPFGEYSHGIGGLKEKLIEIFEVEDYKEVVSLYKRTIKGNIGKNRKCPCRHGKKYKDCHQKVINRILSWKMHNLIDNYIDRIKKLEMLNYYKK